MMCRVCCNHVSGSHCVPSVGKGLSLWRVFVMESGIERLPPEAFEPFPLENATHLWAANGAIAAFPAEEGGVV